MRGLTITGFGNFTSATVTNPERLSAALHELGQLAKMTHFATQVGKRFRPEEIEDAMTYSPHHARDKAVLRFSPDVT
jgi:NADPH:quinone reductase